MHLYPRRGVFGWGLAATLLAFFVALAAFGGGVSWYREQNAARQKDQLFRSIQRAAVTCFAVEGRYPPSLTYLQDHYGVTWPERYLVDYAVFAGNVMPAISVTERGDGR